MPPPAAAVSPPPRGPTRRAATVAGSGVAPQENDLRCLRGIKKELADPDTPSSRSAASPPSRRSEVAPDKHEEARSEIAMSEPIPTHEAAAAEAAASPRALSNAAESSPPVGEQGGHNSSRAGPRPGSARQFQLSPRRSTQFLLFLGFDSVPPGASSSSLEI
jgi:hypothetical protein